MQVKNENEVCETEHDEHDVNNVTEEMLDSLIKGIWQKDNEIRNLQAEKEPEKRKNNQLKESKEKEIKDLDQSLKNICATHSELKEHFKEREKKWIHKVTELI